jgi:hypothetical protein
VLQREKKKKTQLKERRRSYSEHYSCIIYSASTRYARMDIDLIWPKREPQYTRLV